MRASTETWSIDGEVPFGSVFTDFAVRSLDDLVMGWGWKAGVRDQLCEQLRARLSYLAAPALLALFQQGAGAQGTAPSSESEVRAPAGRYRSFVRAVAADNLAQLRDAFPVLGDLLDTTREQWLLTSKALAVDVGGARAELEARLGIDPTDPIEEVWTGLGDRHLGGKAVAKLRTESGVYFIYKPRSMAPEAHFFAIWDAFRALRRDVVATPVVIERSGVGFMQHIEAAPVQDSVAWWRRAGELAGLLHLCVVEDMHNENLIAAGDQVIPVDLECVNQPNRFAEREDRRQFVTDSVLATGLFPYWYVRPGADASDSVGLFAGETERVIGTMPIWQDLGTDQIRRSSVPYTRDQGDNAPRDTRGLPVPCDQRNLFEGLEAAFRLGPALVDGAGPWAPSRFLSRPTSVFAQARAQMLELDALQDRQLFDSRSHDLPVMERELEALLGPEREQLIEADAQALRRLDIPLHRVDGASLLLDGGSVIDGLFNETGVEHRRERIRRLSPVGIRLQRQLVTLSVDQFEQCLWERHVDALATSPLGSRRLCHEALGAARGLGGRLGALAIETNEGPAWLELDQQTPMRATAQQTNLYAGSDGIALFFAALARVTGDQQWAEQARRALHSTPSPNDDKAWVESGWAGRLYTRSVAAALLDDSSLMRDAQALATQGWSRSPTDDDKLDVLGGWCGVLLALLASQSAGIDCGAMATELTSWLAGQVERRLDSPVHERAMIRMGFAHGTTGMSYSLALAACELGHQPARVASLRLAKIEEQRITKRHGIPGSLQGLGAKKVPTRTWCWGVSGYAMARVQPAWQSIHGQVSHVGRAAEILVSPTRGRSHACCGEAGQLMALTELALANGQVEAAPAADALAGALTAEARNDGPWQFYNETSLTPPGLFWGLAGVGYALLHYARPAAVPNFLLFEPVGGFSSRAKMRASVS